MRKINWVLREILCRVYERHERFMSQSSVASACGASLGTTNSIVTKLEQMGAVEKKPLGFRVIDPKKILLYWASIRELKKDIEYFTCSPLSVREIESRIPEGTLLTAFSAVREIFGSTAADYFEVYIYGKKEEIERVFPPRSGKKNLFLLRLDPHLEGMARKNLVPLPQVYVDLWWLGTPAKKFLWKIEQKLEAASLEKIEGMMKRAKAYGGKTLSGP